MPIEAIVISPDQVREDFAAAQRLFSAVGSFATGGDLSTCCKHLSVDTMRRIGWIKPSTSGRWGVGYAPTPMLIPAPAQNPQLAQLNAQPT